MDHWWWIALPLFVSLLAAAARRAQHHRLKRGGDERRDDRRPDEPAPVAWDRRLPVTHKRARAAMSSATDRSIASARDGERVRLVGTVRRDAQVLEGPVSRRPCVVFEVVAEPTGIHTTAVAPAERQMGADFLLDDGTGVARVILSGGFEAALLVDLDRYDTIDQRLAEQLSLPLPEALSLRFHLGERIVAIDQRVEVVGIARREQSLDQASSSGYRADAPAVTTRLVLRGAPGTPLCLTNDP